MANCESCGEEVGKPSGHLRAFWSWLCGLEVAEGGYLVGVVLLTWTLPKLSGGAIWMPWEWRTLVMLLGIAAGLANFRKAWSFRKGLAADVKLLGKDSGESSTSASVQRAFETEREAAKRQVDKVAWGRARLWFAGVLALIGIQAVAMNRQVLTWNPSVSEASGMILEQVGLQGGAENFPERYHFGPAYLERQGEGSQASMRGSIVFPIGFSEFDEGKQLTKVTRNLYPKERNKGTRRFLADHAAIKTIDMIESDYNTLLGATKFLFVLIHVLTMVAASRAYGLTFSSSEELVTQGTSLPDVLGSVLED